MVGAGFEDEEIFMGHFDKMGAVKNPFCEAIPVTKNGKTVEWNLEPSVFESKPISSSWTVALNPTCARACLVTSMTGTHCTWLPLNMHICFFHWSNCRVLIEFWVLAVFITMNRWHTADATGISTTHYMELHHVHTFPSSCILFWKVKISCNALMGVYHPQQTICRSSCAHICSSKLWPIYFA